MILGVHLFGRGVGTNRFNPACSSISSDVLHCDVRRAAAYGTNATWPRRTRARNAHDPFVFPGYLLYLPRSSWRACLLVRGKNQLENSFSEACSCNAALPANHCSLKAAQTLPNALIETFTFRSKQPLAQTTQHVSHRRLGICETEL